MSHNDTCPRRHGEHVDADALDLICDACRAYLLGDTDVDPLPKPTWQQPVYDEAQTGLVVDAIITAAGRTTAPELAAVLEQWIDELAEPHADNDWHERLWHWYAATAYEGESELPTITFDVDTTDLDTILARIDELTEDGETIT